MTGKPIRTAIVAMTIAAVLSTGLTPANAQVVVYDPTNYIQNVLSATRALQQINNQIKALQNEAQMLQNMARNLQKLDVSSLAKINSDLAAINDLMKAAKGIAFTIEDTERAFKAQFPASYGAGITTGGLVAEAQTRWQSAMDAYQNTLTVQAQVDQNLQSDADTLATLLRASESSEGDLQAQQASNQLLALSTKQQMQIETLLAAQYRADALDQARKVQAEAAAKAMTAKFLGTGKAYTPQ
ncbi:MAG: P-type conjugative transfer protein TrbJ [Asticcacaulis sp.]|nr:P-type conjugative transfer protein TrbJ [Asticcacaulis sp.]